MLSEVEKQWSRETPHINPRQSNEHCSSCLTRRWRDTLPWLDSKASPTNKNTTLQVVMTRRRQTSIFMFLKRGELLDLGHDELYASWLYMVIQFVCPLSLYWICWAVVGHWSHDYKSWVNSEHQNAITNPENYWGSTTRPCVIGVWCSTESGDMSWLQNPFFWICKAFFHKVKDEWLMSVHVCVQGGSLAPNRGEHNFTHSVAQQQTSWMKGARPVQVRYVLYECFRSLCIASVAVLQFHSSGCPDTVRIN